MHINYRLSKSKLAKSAIAISMVAALSACSTVGSAPTLGDLFAAAPNVNSALNVLSFKPSPRSGIIKNVQFEAIPATGRPDDLNHPTLASIIERVNLNPGSPLAEIYSKHCIRPAITSRKARSLFIPDGSGIIVQVANLLFDAIFDELSSRVDQIRKASTKDYQNRLVLRNAALWGAINCFVLVRTLDKSEDTSSDLAETGMLVVLRKHDLGAYASRLSTVYAEMDHAMAVTSRDQEKIKLDIGFAIHASAQERGRNTIFEVAGENIPSMTLDLGQAISLCPQIVDGTEPCPNAAPLFASPIRNNSSVLAIDFSVQENGSAASEITKANAGIEALEKITRPSFDRLLEAIADG